MRVRPRVPFVGFLLVVGLAVSGCQPVQPVPASSAPSVNEIIVESTPVTDTATLPESVPIAEGNAETGTVTMTVPLTVPLTVPMTVEVTATTEMSGSAVASPTDASASADPALLVAGLGVYRAQYCGVCHVLDVAETRGTFGPAHNDMEAIATERLQDENYGGDAKTAAEYIRESIVDPQRYIVPGYAATAHRMPPYAHLDVESLDALVAFLAAQ